MRQTSWFALVFGLGLFGGVGCGGNVVVDGPGEGGGGNGNTGTTSGTGTTTTTVDPPKYCALVCSQYSVNGCLFGSTLDECEEGCEQLFGTYPECKQELKDLYECLIADMTENGCATSDLICQTEALSYGECVGGGSSGCEEYGCDDGGGSCSCDGQCGGVFLETQCKQADEGYYCACYIDGQAVGECGQSAACGIFDGCCSQYFFEQK